MKYTFCVLFIFLSSISYAHNGIFIRGDSNDDGVVNVSDMTYISNYLFSGGPEPANMDAADVNDDGAVNVSDFGYLSGFLFNGGSQPPAPFIDADLDLTGDNLEPTLSPEAAPAYNLDIISAWMSRDWNHPDQWEQTTYSSDGVGNTGGGTMSTENGVNGPDCDREDTTTTASLRVLIDEDDTPPHAVSWSLGHIGIDFKVTLDVIVAEYGEECDDGYLCGDSRENILSAFCVGMKIVITNGQINQTLDDIVVVVTGDEQKTTYILSEVQPGNCEVVTVLALPTGDRTYECRFHEPINFAAGGGIGENWWVDDIYVSYAHEFDRFGAAWDHAESEVLYSSIEVHDIRLFWAKQAGE